jgi:predicted nucleic acid-binding protein
VTHGADTTFLIAVEIIEHEHHADALRVLNDLLAQGDRIALAPQVLAEFVHVVTDARRFERPLPMEIALDKSGRWWNAAETDHVFPTDVAVARFHEWMRRHQIGRKRVLDTFLAATYYAAHIGSLLTLDPEDFSVFSEFTCVRLAPTA